MDNWQPIESAPKGEHFQAWVTCDGEGWWEPWVRINPDTECQEIWDRAVFDEEGWQSYEHFELTHWMPQPKTPDLTMTPEKEKPMIKITVIEMSDDTYAMSTTTGHSAQGSSIN